jgi:hypothetical protein
MYTRRPPSFLHVVRAWQRAGLSNNEQIGNAGEKQTRRSSQQRLNKNEDFLNFDSEVSGGVHRLDDAICT